MKKRRLSELVILPFLGTGQQTTSAKSPIFRSILVQQWPQGGCKQSLGCSPEVPIPSPCSKPLCSKSATCTRPIREVFWRRKLLRCFSCPELSFSLLPPPTLEAYGSSLALGSKPRDPRDQTRATTLTRAIAVTTPDP